VASSWAGWIRVVCSASVTVTHGFAPWLPE
jgi:hypothetical protein